MSRLVPRGSASTRRTGQARLVMAVVVLVSLACLVLGLKLTVMQLAAARGIDSLRRGDFAQAEGWLKVNLVANWFERWRAPYNVGVALYSQGKWTLAERQFSDSLALAPGDKHCVVALNLAWSYEAEGDQFNQLGDYVQALTAWKQAEAVAKDAGCDYAGKGDQGQSGQANSQSQASGQNASSSASTSRTVGTLPEQQQGTETRVGEKVQSVASSANQQAANNPGQPSQQARTGALGALNQQSQAIRQQTLDGTKNNPPAASNGGKRTW